MKDAVANALHKSILHKLQILVFVCKIISQHLKGFIGAGHVKYSTKCKQTYKNILQPAGFL